MRRFIRLCLIPLLLTFCGALPLASADDSDFKNLHPNAGQGIIQPAAPSAPADTSDKVERPLPTLAVFAAVISTIVVLCVICAPSRKAESASRK